MLSIGISERVVASLDERRFERDGITGCAVQGAARSDGDDSERAAGVKSSDAEGLCDGELMYVLVRAQWACLGRSIYLGDERWDELWELHYELSVVLSAEL